MASVDCICFLSTKLAVSLINLLAINRICCQSTGIHFSVYRICFPSTEFAFRRSNFAFRRPNSPPVEWNSRSSQKIRKMHQKSLKSLHFTTTKRKTFWHSNEMPSLSSPNSTQTQQQQEHHHTTNETQKKIWIFCSLYASELFWLTSNISSSIMPIRFCCPVPFSVARLAVSDAFFATQTQIHTYAHTLDERCSIAAPSSGKRIKQQMRTEWIRVRWLQPHRPHIYIEHVYYASRTDYTPNWSYASSGVCDLHDSPYRICGAAASVRGLAARSSGVVVCVFLAEKEMHSMCCANTMV